MATLIDNLSEAAKARAARHPEKQKRPDSPIQRKPDWIRVRAPMGEVFSETKKLVKENGLVTVCEEAGCPNIGECWSQKHATFMILGDTCTRACSFCNVKTGMPASVDHDEARRIGEAVLKMGLEHVVITSVDRDDLDDGGAAHYAACIRAIKARTPHTSVEALTPDFDGVHAHIETVVDAGLEVFAQNVETVRRLTHPVRDPRAGYEKTIDVLRYAKRHRPDVLTKTSLMLGLGEQDREIIETMYDLREAAVDILTLGQYLRPTPNHLAVERYVTPEQFDAYRQEGLELGFVEVVAGPMVRSSYRAEQVLKKNNVGLAV